MDQQINCEICCDLQCTLVEMNCKHLLCFDCFKIAVVPKEICPYCKQIVTSILLDNKEMHISEFEKPLIEEKNFFDDANFDLVDETFFADDIRILHNNLNRANQIMIRTLRQTDQQFNLKWFIFDQIAQQVHNLNFTNSMQVFQEINNLNVCLNNIIVNNWDQHHFNDLKQAFNFEQMEENYQFVIEKKSKRNKKRKQKQ